MSVGIEQSNILDTIAMCSHYRPRAIMAKVVIMAMIKP